MSRFFDKIHFIFWEKIFFIFLNEMLFLPQRYPLLWNNFYPKEKYILYGGLIVLYFVYFLLNFQKYTIRRLPFLFIQKQLLYKFPSELKSIQMR